jgi:hypothetical protein
MNFNKEGYDIISKGFEDVDLAVKNHMLKARSG